MLFSVRERGDAHEHGKGPGEMGVIAEPNAQGDIGDTSVGLRQEPAGGVDAGEQKVTAQGRAEEFAE